MSRFHNRNFELLEPYDAKVSCTVLRGERGSNTPDLPDNNLAVWDKIKMWDPELGSAGSSKYPLNQTWTVGLEFGF
ncbi:hypothetical protein C803_04999 [Parabacteroides goldsteinii dnLKV18]|uniref:TonB-dependent receptor-like beta-barrel domain-containing protein n=1 Tax=Parabacteroides goldsteinii dnLKV18 TaxID=1235789 RepID=S0GNJ4_9BACT|nr:hypothetical protein C803_04999 [Parabacteroides goldsteinii dnLKV18]